jgi:hypothetical protein
MIRVFARLALDALITEARLWLHPPGSEPVPAPAQGWTPPVYTKCYACAGVLEGHPSLCVACLRARGMAP